jgi:GNAT superfamily N-acetyltransferase
MNKYNIKIIEPVIAASVCRNITSTLPEWFGIPEANERYEKGMLERVSLVASIDDDYIGLIALEMQFPNNVNIYWMAVQKKYHGQGVGTSLIEAAEKYCHDRGYNSMTVETVSSKQNDRNYLKTYNFYKKIGFVPLFEMYTYGPDNLMVYMQKIID